MKFKKIYIYLEVFLCQFYSFHYQNCYICCIVDMFFKEVLKTDNLNQILQSADSFFFCSTDVNIIKFSTLCTIHSPLQGMKTLLHCN